MVESASGWLREVVHAVELHPSQSIDEANRLFPFLSQQPLVMVVVVVLLCNLQIFECHAPTEGNEGHRM